MFGHDDTQQQPEQPANDGALSAQMPDPIAPSAPAAPTFGAHPSDLTTPEITATSSPHVTTETHTTDHNPSVDSSDSPDDLTALKQQALQHLSPLLGHLDQTPEEKFRTTMMMIQASDNKGLIKDAYKAAQAITDDKARAQALLDIINEINYFSQPQQ